MSKNRSIPLKKIYLAELILVGVCALGIIGLITSKIILLVKPAVPPPSIDIQQLELQKAINVVQN
jgi:hypothetical protein